MESEKGKKTKEMPKDGLKDKAEEPKAEQTPEEREAADKARVAAIKKDSVGGYPSASMNVREEDDGA